MAAAFPLDSSARKGTTLQEQLLTVAVLGEGSPETLCSPTHHLHPVRCFVFDCCAASSIACAHACSMA